MIKEQINRSAHLATEETLSPKDVSVSLAEAATLLYPEGTIPTAAQIAGLFLECDAILRRANTAPLTVHGTLPLLIKQRQGTDSPKISPHPSTSTHLGEMAELWNYGYDSPGKQLLWNILEGPAIQIVTQTQEDLFAVQESFMKTLQQGEYKTRDDYMGQKQDTTPFRRVWARNDRTVKSPHFNRREYTLGRHLTHYRFSSDAQYSLPQIQNASLTLLAGNTEYGAPYFSVLFGVPYDNQRPAPPGRKYADSLTMLRLDFLSGDHSHPAMLTNWDTQGHAVWNTKNEETCITLSANAQETLEQPITLEKLSDFSLTKMSPVEKVETAINILQKAALGERSMGQTPNGRAHIRRAFEKEGENGSCTPAIDETTAHALSLEMARLAERTNENAPTILEEDLLQRAKEGRNVKPTIDRLTAALLQTIDRNPARAWRYIRGINLHRVFFGMDKDNTDQSRFIADMLYRRDEQAALLWAREHMIGFAKSEETPVHWKWGRENLYDTALAAVANRQAFAKLRSGGKSNRRLADTIQRAFRSGLHRFHDAMSPLYLPETNPYRIPHPITAVANRTHLYTGRYPDVEPPEPVPEWNPSDLYFMKLCIELSRKAPAEEDPIVCVLVKNEERFQGRQEDKEKTIVISFDAKKKTGDPMAHAERLAIEQAKERYGSVQGWKLYSNVELCPMCYQTSMENGITRIGFAVQSNMGFYTVHNSLYSEGFAKSAGVYQPDVAAGILLPEALAVFDRNPERFAYMFADARQWYEETIMKPLREKRKKALQYDEYL